MKNLRSIADEVLTSSNRVKELAALTQLYRAMKEFLRTRHPQITMKDLKQAAAEYDKIDAKKKMLQTSPTLKILS